MTCNRSQQTQREHIGQIVANPKTWLKDLFHEAPVFGVFGSPSLFDD
jgi:hypothetical protein